MPARKRARADASNFPSFLMGAARRDPLQARARALPRKQARLAHEGRRMGWEPPLPGPLLHKCVEEREKTRGFALHEPAVGKAGAKF